MQNNHNFWIQEDASRIIVAVAGFMTSTAVQPVFMCMVLCPRFDDDGTARELTNFYTEISLGRFNS